MEVERITQAVVDRAKPAAIDVWINERSLRGFALRVYPSGRKAYVLRYRSGSGERKAVIGEHGAPWKLDPETGAARLLTPELARAEAQRLLGGLADGRDPNALRGVTAAIPTLAAFEARYFEDHATPHKAPASARADRGNFKRHLVRVLGARRLDRITTGDVVRLHGSLKDTPVAANRVVALLRTVLSKARKWGVLPAGHANPCLDVEKFEEGRLERFLQPLELPRVGAALRREGPYARAAIQLLILTGARPSEIVSFRREWLNREAGLGVIPRSKTSKRTGKPRVIPFNPSALAVYDKIRARKGNPYLIPSLVHRGEHMSLYAVEDAWQRVRVAAGVEDVRLMDLRHTFASVAAGEGETLLMIGAILGHTNPATTMRYAHLVGAPVRAGSERVAGIIDAGLKRRM